MVTYRTVLELKYPNFEWTLDDDSNYDTLTWPANKTKPSKEYLDQLIIDETDVQSTETERAAIQNRMREYPKITDQLDMLWHALDADSDLQNKFSVFYQNIKTVKDNNPKF